MFLAMANAFFQESAQTQMSPIATIVPFVVIFGVFYLLLIRPQMKQQKEQRKLIDNLKKGDKVITSGGVWGEIDSVEPRFVRLKINEKNKIVVTRSAISGYQPSSAEPDSK